MKNTLTVLGFIVMALVWMACLVAAAALPIVAIWWLVTH